MAETKGLGLREPGAATAAGAQITDSRVELVEGTPIVTMSLGATRTFRVRPAKGKGFVDFDANLGTVFVMPWETNLNTKHEVPHQKSANGRRISITVRAFGP